MPPWLLLVLLVAFILALIYQIASRRYGWRLLLYWVLITTGMLAAEALAEYLGWSFTRYGDLRLLPDLLGAILVLTAFWFLGV
jgi:hypothetical protein